MNILIKPVVTEKMQKITDKLHKYGFIVTRDASKDQIAKAITTMYAVEVESVNTMVYNGKRKSRNTKQGLVHGKKAAFKKAIITLKDGQEIDFYANI